MREIHEKMRRAFRIRRIPMFIAHRQSEGFDPVGVIPIMCDRMSINIPRLQRGGLTNTRHANLSFLAKKP